MNKKYLLLSMVICALVAANVWLLLAGQSPAACYKDACIIGEKDPVAELKALVTSKHVIILVEGDVGNSQKNELLAGAMIRLAKDFGAKNLTLMTLELQAGAPGRCTCEQKVNATGFENCSGGLAECISVAPDSESVLLKISYPQFGENRIVIENRTIGFRAKSGEDALALVSVVFEPLIQGTT